MQKVFCCAINLSAVVAKRTEAAIPTLLIWQERPWPGKLKRAERANMISMNAWIPVGICQPLPSDRRCHVQASDQLL